MSFASFKYAPCTFQGIHLKQFPLLLQSIMDSKIPDPNLAMRVGIKLCILECDLNYVKLYLLTGERQHESLNFFV